MSNFTFRPSARENIHGLIGLISGTGGGKTYSALRLATGLAAGKKFCVIDTEARRALHYADRFQFDHGDLKAPFTPEAYLAAIIAAEAAGYPVAVVDSMSHEHAGEGGLLDQHEAELVRMAGNDYEKRERVKFAAWIKPKMAHKRMVARLLQLRMHLILCFRAEPKMKPQKDPDGKTQFVDAGWLPICAKGLEFELTCSFLLAHEHPGIYKKEIAEGFGKALKLPEDLRACFPEGKPIDESCGERLAAWAAGGASAPPARAAAGPAPASERPTLESPPPDAEVQLISDSQIADLQSLIEEAKPHMPLFFKWLEAVTGAGCIEQIPAKDYGKVVAKLEQRRAAGSRA